MEDREEFCKRLGIEEQERIKLVRKLLPERYRELKVMLEKYKMENPPEEVKMARELINLCEKKYGTNFSLLNDQEAENICKVVSDFKWKLEQKSPIGKEPGE